MVSTVPGLFHESEVFEKCCDVFDVIVCGGTLGVFIATALSSKGLRVGIVERGILKGVLIAFSSFVIELLESLKFIKMVIKV